MLSMLQNVAQVSSDYDFDTSYSTYSSSTDSMSAGSTALGVGVILFALLFALVIYLFFSICLMKIFKKAGRTDSWAAFVPVYNMYVYFEVAGRPGWWAFLAFVPFVGGVISLVTSIIASLDMAKSFGKEVGFGILLALLPVIGYPMLAFGSAQYQGPAGPEGQGGDSLPPQTPVQPQTPTDPQTNL